MFEEFRDSVLSVTEVAKQLHVHVATVHRWTKSGVRGRRLPSILVGGRRFIRVADIEAFVKAPPRAAATIADHRNRAAQQKLLSLGLAISHRRGNSGTE